MLLLLEWSVDGWGVIRAWIEAVWSVCLVSGRVVVDGYCRYLVNGTGRSSGNGGDERNVGFGSGWGLAGSVFLGCLSEVTRQWVHELVEL